MADDRCCAGWWWCKLIGANGFIKCSGYCGRFDIQLVTQQLGQRCVLGQRFRSPSTMGQCPHYLLMGLFQQWIDFDTTPGKAVGGLPLPCRRVVLHQQIERL